MKYGILFCFLWPFLSHAQNKDTVLKYLDEQLHLTTKKNAVYYGVAVKQGDHWMLYALYPDTTPILKAYFRDRELKIKDGPYHAFYPKRLKAQQGYYADNLMYGIWQTWYTNGQLKDSGMVNNNQMTGEWKTWYPNGQLMILEHYKERPDSLKTRAVFAQFNNIYTGYRDGEIRTWYPDGKLESSGTFANDQMQGTWKWYHDNGHPSTVEEYHQAKLTAIECFDTLGNKTGDFCAVARPAVLQEYGNYKEFIYQNLRWPEEAFKKKIQGEVKVQFTINKHGVLENLVLECEQEILKKAVLELFDQMKDWYPAVSHNRAISSEEKMTIPFYFRNGF
jgi:TonB family protein